MQQSTVKNEKDDDGNGEIVPYHLYQANKSSCPASKSIPTQTTCPSSHPT
jgi:hypothetical protein